MIYFILWFLIGSGIYLLDLFWLEKKDMTFKDIGMCILFGCLMPLALIGFIMDIFDKKGKDILIKNPWKEND